MTTSDKASKRLAEFDSLADEYRAVHEKNVAITGEAPEYFAEYKIADIASKLGSQGEAATSITDFGCGIGNSIPFFRKYFPAASLTCADVSARSIEIARCRFPGFENFAQIGEQIPIEPQSQDIVFTACVFHHIPHDEHLHWLGELRRITKPGGYLAIFEHNPFNPLTRRAVNTCPLDANAHLIRANIMQDRVRSAGWIEATTAYKVFFPAPLARLRSAESWLEWLPLGAQYRLLARNSQ